MKESQMYFIAKGLNMSGRPSCTSGGNVSLGHWRPGFTPRISFTSVSKVDILEPALLGPGPRRYNVNGGTGLPGAGIMEADDRQVTTVFTVQPSFHHRHSTNRVS